MSHLVLIILFLLICPSIFSQITEVWNHRYNGPGNGTDQANDLVIDAAGNVYITGNSIGVGTFYDYLTIKYNSSGTVVWVQRYNSGPGNSEDWPLEIAIDASGNVYVTGRSRLENSINDDYLTIKYNSSGVEQWVRRYNGPGNSYDTAIDIAVDAAGNVYVLGYSRGNGTGYDYATVKYNSLGALQWVQRYNGAANSDDLARSMVIDSLGYIYVTGSSVESTSSDFSTIKYNSQGVQQWIQSYNGPKNLGDGARSIAVDISGNVYVTGHSRGNTGNFDFVTIKYNSAGNQQWAQRYNGPGNSDDIARNILVDATGNVYVSGGSRGSGSNNDFATIKYNSLGVEQWVQRYNGPENLEDIPWGLTADQSGNVYVTGESDGIGSSRDYAAVKYNSLGVEQWVQRYNGPANSFDIALGIGVDGLNNVYVTGGSDAGETNLDFFTIKYSQTIGIQQISSEIPSSFSLKQNYPNPFNPLTNIEFDIPKASFTKLIIYDILGREIETIVNNELKAGVYRADWDASAQPSGVYFYRLIAGDYSATKKMILVK